MIKELLNSLTGFFELKEPASVALVLPCITALFSTKQVFEAVELRLLPRPQATSLVQHLVKLASSSAPRTVRTDALQAVAAAVGTYFGAVTADWQLLLGCAKSFAAERDDQVLLAK